MISDLTELHLESNSTMVSAECSAAISLLTQLNKLTLINWHICQNLPQIIQDAISITRLILVPSHESSFDEGVQAGRVMAMLEKMRFLREFVWGIRPEFVLCTRDEDHIKVWPVKVR